MPFQALLSFLLIIMNILKKGLSNNLIKLIAIISMAIDHTGLILLNNYTPFRIMGRLAFPIFAYLISEGCFFTKSRKRYFMNVFLVGVICQIVYFITTGNWYLNILLTFSISILIIGAYIEFRKTQKGNIYFTVFLLNVFIIVYILEIYGIYFDYGFIGIITPYIIFIAPDKKKKIVNAAIMLILLSLNQQGSYVQFFSLFSLPVLVLYNGKRGKYNLKTFFYLFYPAHLGILYLLNLIKQ